jgi:hypothetical protein
MKINRFHSPKGKYTLFTSLKTMKNLKLYCTIILFFLAILPVFSQNFPHDYWHEGELTLFSGENLVGRIKYDLEKDNIQITLSSNGTVKTYSSRNVESFEFIDAVLRIRRSFFSLPFQKTAGYESPMFFELLTDGEVALLNREAVVVRSVPMYYGGMAPMFTNVSVLIDNFYFLVKSEQKVIKFDEKRETILAVLGNKQDKISDYLKANKVNFSNRKDLMQLFDYYNSVQ